MWLLAAALLLALRKPWALHTPQLYAEDGSVFLVQDLHLGIPAWWVPYNGYLHLLPRLTAWLARVTVDPAWWPAAYNGLAFAVTAGLFARLASARVQLPAPAKPWLMLAFAAVASSGEVLINITNLQWLTAFFLVLQLVTAPPPTLRQQLGDFALLLLIGLNGPFAVVFTPLFALRWLFAARCPNRAAPDLRLLFSPAHRHRLLDFAAVALAAGIQAAFFFRANAGLALEAATAAAPFNPLAFTAVLGARLVTWPLLGPAIARAAPLWVHVTAALLLVPALTYSLRHDTLRRARAVLVAAVVLITLACAVRARADLMAPGDLLNGDRYFYIPRLLLAWLLILEFHSARPWLARAARATAVLALVFHLPHFILPAPPDYRWADHCDPIRRAEAANIHTLPEGWFIEFPGGLRKP